MALISVEEALARILAGAAPGPGDGEEVAIAQAVGRITAEALSARFDQPPFAASAMDGYAVRAADVATLPARLAVIGQAAAGHPFAGSVAAGQAVRIFTGAPVPAGADAIVVQENTAAEPGTVVVRDGAPDPEHVRARGGDFGAGEALIGAGRRLTPRLVTLAAAMGIGHIRVRRRPLVAILATGDELVAPGEPCGTGQIHASNHLGVAAMVTEAGGSPLLLGIARDTRESLDEHLARSAGADVVVTIGGASVGDHDLVGPALAARGLALDFWKIAMRPGKPLMFGRLGAQRVIGLPGNPVSALVCARVFLVPLLAALLGRPQGEAAASAATAVPLPPNGPRAHYMRATLAPRADGPAEVTPLPNQDSSLLSPLARADCLLVRPAGAPPLARGATVPILPLDF